MLRFFQKLSTRSRKARPAARQPFVCPSLENLTERITPSVTVGGNGTSLDINGTAGRDWVVVFRDQSNSGQLTVRFNGHNTPVNNPSAITNITFNGQAGNDVFINTTELAVTAHGGAGNDLLVGGSGNDQLFGESGNDRIFGGAGDDTINVGSGINAVAGLDGNDTIIATSGINFLFGGAGNDTITGGTGRDQIFGGDGDDIVHGGAGNDIIFAEAGDDHVFGEAGNDILGGSLGDDRLNGGAGNDFLFGSFGDDRLVGDIGNDRLFGLAGNDILSGGAGRDLLRGGEGNDLDDRHNEDFGDDAEMHELVANLSVPSGSVNGVSGVARLEAGDDSNFKVEVQGLAANATFTIKVNGTTLSQTLTTDANGQAKLSIFDSSLNVMSGQMIQILDSQSSAVLQGTFGPDGDTKS